MTRAIQDQLDKNFSITIQHLPSNSIVSFSGFVDTFSDSYKQKWSSEEVYGRMDPMYFYQNTTRQIKIDFSVPSENALDAEANFKKLSKLMRFSYPTYEAPKTNQTDAPAQAPAAAADAQATEEARQALSSASSKTSASGNALLLSTPPLIAINFSNFISSPVNSGRLIGKMDSISFDAEQGATYYSVGKNLFPAFFKVKLQFDPIHATPLGWVKSGANNRTTPRNKTFPYGV